MYILQGAIISYSNEKAREKTVLTSYAQWTAIYLLIIILNIQKQQFQKTLHSCYIKICLLLIVLVMTTPQLNLQLGSLLRRVNTLWGSISLFQSDHKITRIIQAKIGSLFGFSTICSLVTQQITVLPSLVTDQRLCINRTASFKDFRLVLA